ncbi:MAG: Maf family protein, partial [Nitrospiraceae bacterium]|nr:Maf family protein [Nitrospiraceae bacterium]
MPERRIILASSSPRRKELLSLTGLKFTVDAGDYEEILTSSVPPRSLARRLSLGKAETVSRRYGNALIIAADTFITFRGNLLGKPHTPKEAGRMLRLLGGKTHSVITGFTVLDTASGKRRSRSVETRVRFRKLTPSEIRAYVRTGEPLDKAGGYAIQGIGSLLVREIEGDYFNVIGL